MRRGLIPVIVAEPPLESTILNTLANKKEIVKLELPEKTKKRYKKAVRMFSERHKNGWLLAQKDARERNRRKKAAKQRRISRRRNRSQ